MFLFYEHTARFSRLDSCHVVGAKKRASRKVPERKQSFWRKMEQFDLDVRNVNDASLRRYSNFWFTLAKLYRSLKGQNGTRSKAGSIESVRLYRSTNQRTFERDAQQSITAGGHHRDPRCNSQVADKGTTTNERK